MPSQEAIAETVNRYLELVAKGTADDVLTLYAADATIEDPIGSDLRRGHEAIREFYRGFQDAKKKPNSPNCGSPAAKRHSCGTSGSTPVTAAPKSHPSR